MSEAVRQRGNGQRAVSLDAWALEEQVAREMELADLVGAYYETCDRGGNAEEHRKVLIDRLRDPRLRGELEEMFDFVEVVLQARARLHRRQ
jgi:hypothetical protein